MVKYKRTSPLYAVRQLITFVLVMLVFLLPVIVTAQWIYGMDQVTDKREVYSNITSFSKRPTDSNKKINPFAEPLLTISFDDGWESTYSVGLPLMQQYGVKATHYILAGEFSNTLYLSQKQVKSFQDYGHEIAGHSFSHANLTRANDEVLQKELIESKAILEKKFGPIKDFASPLGAQNEHTLKLIAQHYRSQRNTAADPKIIGDEDVNTAANFNRYNIIAYTVRKNTTLAELQGLVEYAAQRNAWVVLTYHQLVDDGSQFAVTRDQFESHLKLLYKLPIRTATIGEVLDAIELQAERSVR